MTKLQQKGSEHIRLTRAQEAWLNGFASSSGTSSPLSHLTVVGARKDLTPTVVLLSQGDGLRRFLTVLATTSALKEDRSGEHTLMLSLGLERAVLTSMLESFPSDGASDEIRFELLIPAGAPDGTSPNTSLRTQISGISGARCDLCGKGFKENQSYVQECSPLHQTMYLYHRDCFYGQT